MNRERAQFMNYDQLARQILDDLRRYEQEHPKGAICLVDALSAAHDSVSAAVVVGVVGHGTGGER